MPEVLANAPANAAHPANARPRERNAIADDMRVKGLPAVMKPQ